MKSSSTGADGTPFGIYQPTSSHATFLYDHRGGRVANAIELVQWLEPATTGSVYPDPWLRGIQTMAYTAADLDTTAQRGVALGGEVVRRGPGWMLMRDPEGVSIEVIEADGPSEARYVRIVCSDLERSIAWWSQLGYTKGTLPTPPASEIWLDGPAHRFGAEQAMLPTDYDTFGVVLTTWDGPTPAAGIYGMPYHQGLYWLAVAVEDAQHAFEAFDALGVARQSVYTFDLPGTKLTDGLTMLFVRDPDSVLVELVQRPRQGRIAAQ